jgi:hypothetical protein
MKYLIDTSVWSLVLRRSESKNENVVQLLSKLIDRKEVVFCGAVRQELLSGIRDSNQFEILKSRLRSFEDLITESKDYELAAEIYNTCKAKGIQASNTDFLLCALAANHNVSLLSSDQDFLLINKHYSFPLQFVKI